MKFSRRDFLVDSLAVAAAKDQDPDILTGGGFGAEASIISVVLGAALSVAMLAIWYRKSRSSAGKIQKLF